MSSYIRYVALAFLFFGVIQPGKAFGQEVWMTHNPRDSALAFVLGNASESRRLRIHVRNGLRVDDPKPRMEKDSVIIRFGRSTQKLSLPEIDSVWVQRGTMAGIFGAIAAVPCAIFGALAVHALATDPDGNGGPGNGPKGAVVGAVMGTVACGLPGLALGSLIKRWRLIFPVAPPNR
jgi:hypothetical protein